MYQLHVEAYVTPWLLAKGSWLEPEVHYASACCCVASPGLCLGSGSKHACLSLGPARWSNSIAPCRQSTFAQMKTSDVMFGAVTVCSAARRTTASSAFSSGAAFLVSLPCHALPLFPKCRFHAFARRVDMLRCDATLSVRIVEQRWLCGALMTAETLVLPKWCCNDHCNCTW